MLARTFSLQSKRISLNLCVIFVIVLSLGACSLFSKPKAVQYHDRVLKKKVVMTAMAVKLASQVQDVDDIAQGMPREILSRLDSSGSFLVRQSHNLLSFDLQQEAPSARLVQQVAAENDAQFVIAGEIRNAGVRAEPRFLGLWEHRQRHIEIEFAIYDGVTGVRISRHHLYRPAGDDSRIGRDKPFGSVTFYATKFGQAIDAVMQESVAWIRQDLANYPMLAKIVQVKDQHIYLDAGASSNLVIGDAGLAIAAYEHLPAWGIKAQQSQPLAYGAAQASMGRVKVAQVQLPFSMLDTKEISASELVQLKVGDYVRFDGKPVK